VVEQLAYNLKIEGLNPATGTEKEGMTKKGFEDVM
jgi:hypothetical protein